jgi:hypothetical protein
MYIAPVSGFPVGPDTALFFLWNSCAELAVQPAIATRITVLMRRFDGKKYQYETTQYDRQVAPAAQTRLSFKLNEGELISVSVWPSANSLFLGRADFIVSCSIGRASSVGTANNQPGNFMRYAVLFNEYMNQYAPVSWPGSPVRMGISKDGTYIDESVASPGPGTPLQWSPPARQIVQLQSIISPFSNASGFASVPRMFFAGANAFIFRDQVGIVGIPGLPNVTLEAVQDSYAGVGVMGTLQVGGFGGAANYYLFSLPSFGLWGDVNSLVCQIQWDGSGGADQILTSTFYYQRWVYPSSTLQP